MEKDVVRGPGMGGRAKWEFYLLIREHTLAYEKRTGDKLQAKVIARVAGVDQPLLAKWLNRSEPALPKPEHIARLCGFFSLSEEDCRRLYECFAYKCPVEDAGGRGSAPVAPRPLPQPSPHEL